MVTMYNKFTTLGVVVKVTRVILSTVSVLVGIFLVESSTSKNATNFAQLWHYRFNFSVGVILILIGVVSLLWLWARRRSQ